MACVNVPISEEAEQSQCQPGGVLSDGGYWRVYPTDPPEQNERGIKALCVAYDANDNIEMQGEFWVKEGGKGWVFTRILPDFPR